MKRFAHTDWNAFNEVTYTLTDDFDKDFGAGGWHGANAFIRDGDTQHLT